MKKHRLVASVAAAVPCLVLAPRAARGDCCVPDGGVVALIALVTVGVTAFDIGFTIHDFTVDRPSLGAGVFETVGAVPQAVLFGVGAFAAASDPGLHLGGNGVAALLGALSVWSGLLAAHGIWSIATAGQTATGIAPVSATQVLRPRVQCSLTYVTVGQISAPAAGLVGRF